MFILCFVVFLLTQSSYLLDKPCILNQDNLMSSHETELFVPSDSNHSVFENILNYNDIGLWPQNLKHSEIYHIIVTA